MDPTAYEPNERRSLTGVPAESSPAPDPAPPASEGARRTADRITDRIA